MSAHSDRLDQFEEGNAAGGHAGELEAILYPTVSPSMTPRRFPTPWHADKLLGGYVVRDASGQALAYSRDTSRSRRWRTGRATAERAPGELRRAVVAPKHRLDSGYRGFLPFAQCEQSCSLDKPRDHRISWLPVVGGASCSRFENPDLSAGFVAPAPHHSVSAERDEAGWPRQGCQGHRR
jgi:hypothetical protein